MRKRYIVIPIVVVAVVLVIVTMLSSRDSYVSMKSWTSGEILTAGDLNSALSALDTGLDDLQTEMQDSVAAARNGAADSAAVRISGEHYLNWNDAYGTSDGTGDSLTIEKVTSSPLGNGQVLKVTNNQGVTETVYLFTDKLQLNPYERLDSLQTYIWTEATDGTDAITVAVYDDSTGGNWEYAATKTATTTYSSAARTAEEVKITGINIIGGEYRIKTTVATQNDSAFVGRVKVWKTQR